MISECVVWLIVIELRCLSSVASCLSYLCSIPLLLSDLEMEERRDQERLKLYCCARRVGLVFVSPVCRDMTMLKTADHIIAVVQP